jgi:phosphoglycerol transferase MdoB-like AlkP superfamily enzyme
MEDVVLSLEKKEEPYLVICYNVGTHHGYDTSDVKYGDGSNPDLNKFYNFDYWFGKFFNKMKDAGVFDNTIFVFTADHAAYPAPEYCETFNTDRKDFIGRIPLFVYCTDIEPVRYDVGGRNSLSLAPTLMDLLGKTAYPNYFLGTSLFLQPESELNYMSAQGPVYHCTKGGTVVPVSNRDRRVKVIESFCKIHVNE